MKAWQIHAVVLLGLWFIGLETKLGFVRMPFPFLVPNSHVLYTIATKSYVVLLFIY